jgi:hypothetical protein
MSEQQTQVQTEGQPPAAKIEFTPEMQLKIDGLIREAMGRAGREHREAAAKALEDAEKARAEALVLKQELATLRGDKEGIEAAAKAIKAENIRIRKQHVIQDAAAKLGFFNPAQLSKLVGDEIVFDADKNQFHVIGEDGTPRVGLDGSTPLSLDAYFQEYASQNPHLVRGSVVPGIGSREAQQPPHRTLGEREKLTKYFGRGSDGKAANDLALSDPNEYKRLRHAARRLNLI